MGGQAQWVGGKGKFGSPGVGREACGPSIATTIVGAVTTNLALDSTIKEEKPKKKVSYKNLKTNKQSMKSKRDLPEGEKMVM